ncbi:NDP-sugar epimerase, includes UDP-GlcNAc-inverting 4,6-dehydratase FlaA1 and capsular polysaccharide biosynthesis protein EpsC [Cribrihabitans marinus]|uniref:NDP-sugar epimerase, includes UDP-GlcNAc-inverting 4,6-dehydratase FlaA1 and capsular polysaccharide biosynthesis protein EpsC n=1 Tax=Cribrihabitans marinus TaxID=1227549 RepID=A0A1H7E480_9RHOB|nr:nucleoside-diphosphate sugar epimerase/dehydratase [Cribrihabitans marinus]SEK06420.1 NDP-sugar epimerase, includes UDP-GlcNAc-inverting 4,6-dehydratase FlaA1 and capsular polysaccharide biosynthesis protein EpsC [Cribrihabitans marinus]
MLSIVNALSRKQKVRIFLGIDLLLVPLALFFTFSVQSLPDSALGTLRGYLPILPYLMLAAGLLSKKLGLPQIQLKAYEQNAIGLSALLATVLALLSALLARVAGIDMPPGTYVIFGISYFMFSAASRMVLYRVVTELYRRAQPRCRVLIYGAGTTGTQLAQALRAHDSIDPVAFVDDNPSLQGVLMAGLPVFAPAQIPDLVENRGIHRVLLAMPSESRPRQAQVARKLQKMGLEVQALPSFAQLIGEEPLVEKLTPIPPQSFLGRDACDMELAEACESYAGRSVLVSGAGGSIGAELCRQLLACRPARLVLYELSELALYAAHQELQQLSEGLQTEIVPVLGSVIDARQVARVLEDHGVQVLLHAAAYKHVPLVEANPLAGLANNVLGTRTLARAAAEAGVERFILISSDKAVRPTNVMGASKRLAELVVHDLATRNAGTVFTMVRFGNVLGSSGSVVPLFQDQVRRGGPVTVTDPEVKRYFMTLGEAVQLVLKAGAEARGGEIFVLDMGAPVPIVQLARQVIESAGYSVRDANNPDGDIEIDFIGLRPGEKLEEELSLTGDLTTTRHRKIFCAQEAHLSEIEVAALLRGLRHALAAGDVDAARAEIAHWVEGYVADETARRRS